MKKITKKKGITLAMVLMVIMIIVVIGLSISFIGAQNLRNVKKNNDNVQALYAAESGLSRALIKIRENSAWNGYDDPPSNTQLTYSNVPMPSSSHITYTVRVYNNSSGGANLNAENGLVVPPGTILLLGEGRVGTAQNPKAVKKVAALMRKGSVFNWALFAKDGLHFNGNPDIEAYDSSIGLPGNHSQQNGQADCGTNATSPGKVTTNGNQLVVDGDIAIGPGGNISTTIVSNPSTWTPGGDFKVMTSPQELPDVELPPGTGPAQPLPTSFMLDNKYMAQADNYRYHLLLASRKKPAGGGGKPGGTTIMLQPGHYEGISQTNKNTYVLKNYGTAQNPSVYILDGIDLSGGAVLEVDNSNGPVVVICNGDLELRGRTGIQSNLHHGAGSMSPSPMDITILCTDACTTVDMAGNPDAFAAIYAPNSDVNIHGNADVYGSIVGNKIDFKGNAQLWYDIQLRNSPIMPMWEVKSRMRL